MTSNYNIFKEEELDEKVASRKFRHTTQRIAQKFKEHYFSL